MTYNYSTSAFVKNLGVYNYRLYQEINSSSISSAKLLNIDQQPSNVKLTFSASLSSMDQTTLNTIITNHPNNSIKSTILKITDPTTTDDETKGYTIKDEWINSQDKKIWMCISGTKDSAEWIQLNPKLNLTAPANGDLLKYNSATTEWNNSNPLSVNTRAYKFANVVNNSTVLTTTSATFISVGVSITTSSVANLDYIIKFESELNTTNSTTPLDFQILVGGVVYGLKNSTALTKNVIISTTTYVPNVPTGTVITVQVKRNSGTGTCVLTNKTLLVLGI